MTPQEIRDEFCQIPFDFKPGKRLLYNNSGYHLLGMIIEQVCGIEYEQFVQQEIFDPLGMKRSFFMHNAAIIPRRANGYSRDEGGFKNADYLSMTQPYASGSLGSTVEDMVLWAKAVYENRLISKETQKRMWAPTVLEDGSTESYGFGWGLGDYRGHPFVHHSGGVNGFSTFMAQFRAEPISIIVLANREGFDADLFTMKVARLALGLPAIIRKPVEISAESQVRVVGKYMVDEQRPLEIFQENGELFLKKKQQHKLFPLSETAFYTDTDPEAEIRFSNEQDGKYQHLSRVSSMHTFTAVRHEE